MVDLAVGSPLLPIPCRRSASSLTPLSRTVVSGKLRTEVSVHAGLLPLCLDSSWLASPSGSDALSLHTRVAAVDGLFPILMLSWLKRAISCVLDRVFLSPNC